LGSKVPVYVRESTGLVKNASLLDAVALNISNMSAGVALGTVGFSVILLPSVTGLNMVYASIIAFILSVPQIVVYTMLSTRLARTGGDYVWVSRNVNGAVGSVMTFAGWTMGNMPYFSLTALSAVFALGSVGVVLGNSNFLQLSLPSTTAGSAPFLQFFIAAGMILALILINVFKPNWGFKLVSILTVIGITTLVLGILSIVAGGQGGVVNYMNSLNAQGANETYASVAAAYPGGGFNFSNTFLVLPFFALFIYPYLSAGPAVSSELKGGGRTKKWNVPIGAVTVFLLVTGAFAAMYYAGGTAFINEALSNSTLVYNYSFNFWTLAMGVTGNSVLSYLLGIGWILWNVQILAYLVIVMSRYLFAQAFDRFLPTRIASLNERWGSPVTAYAIELAIGVGLVAAVIAYYGSLVALYGTAALTMLYFATVGLAALFYARRNEKGRAKIIMAVAGVLTTIVFLIFDYLFLAYPGIWGGNSLAYGYNVGAVIAGILIYFASRRYHMSRGLDISMVFKELPPE
jgi:amino acid transporter